MIQRRICKSNRILLSYTSPIGTPKSGNNNTQCVRVRIGPTISVQSFNGMENGTPPYRWELNHPLLSSIMSYMRNLQGTN